MASGKRRLIAAAVVILLLISVSGFALADPPEVDNPLGVEFNAGKFLDGLITVLKWVLAIAFIVVAGAAIYLGFQLVASAGNPRRRAEVMDGLKDLLIGGIFIFGAFFITSLLKQLADWIFGVAHP